MNLIRAALGELTDLELAYFATYTAVNLAADTQKQIKVYLRERNLTKARISTLIAMNENSKAVQDQKERCPRCKSDKICSSQEPCTEDQVWLTYADIMNDDQPALGARLSKTSVECKVCAYPLSEESTPKPPFPGVRVFTSSLRS